MAKLKKDQALWIAEYAHFVQRHAHSEQAIMQAVVSRASDATRDELISNAQWYATEAVRAADRIGLPTHFIQTDILDRAE